MRRRCSSDGGPGRRRRPALCTVPSRDAPAHSGGPPSHHGGLATGDAARPVSVIPLPHAYGLWRRPHVHHRCVAGVREADAGRATPPAFASAAHPLTLSFNARRFFSRAPSGTCLTASRISAGRRSTWPAAATSYPHPSSSRSSTATSTSPSASCARRRRSLRPCPSSRLARAPATRPPARAAATRTSASTA